MNDGQPQPTQSTPPRMNVSRRQFVVSSSVAGAAAATTASWLPRLVLASQQQDQTRDLLITITLRGGADGLAMCVPYGDPAYASLRPTSGLGIAPAGTPGGCTDLDGFFGLHPALADLHSLYRAGHLAIVHAVGAPEFNASHATAQQFLESGDSTGAPNSGWLARHLAATKPIDPSAPIRAVALGVQLPTLLQNAPAGSAVAASANLEPAEANISLSAALNQAASLARANPRLEAITIETTGWDTHAKQGGAAGTLAATMRDLGAALRAFYDQTILTSRRNITVLVMTEFGRTISPNALGGTDHGHASAMLVLGRKVAGGQVIARWPGLTRCDHLEATIDTRDVIAELLHKRLGNTNVASIFPGYTPTFRGVVVS